MTAEIGKVNGSHMAQPEGPISNYPNLVLEQAFVKAFSNEIEGNVALEKVKIGRIGVRSNVQDWVTGMNSIIVTWNQMPEHTEAEIRTAFAPELA